jgi:hypothetical protein
MGSQALGSPAEAAPPKAATAPVPSRGGRPRPLTVAALVAGAWILPVLTQLTKTDPLLVVLIVFGTGGLLRVGATVVDRLMLTLALLIGLAVVGGLLFSVWPWGLQPIAVGGLALTLLVGAYAWLGAPPPWRTWPRRLLGSDAVLLLAFVAATLVAYWPSFGVGVPRGLSSANRLGFAGLTGDRLRHFSLFDTIHRLGGYTFLMQGQAKSHVDPAMLAIYPPGQHYVYALGDIFLRSSVNPGGAVTEMDRYNIWVSLGYGFFVACVAWAARWVAGPYLTGWRRVFLTTAIVGFLTVGAFTSAIWCTWDPQVFGMALLALLAAVCFRPPGGVRTHVALMALLFIANCLTYELYGPFAAILIAVSLVVYRRRLWPHWRMLAVVAVVTVPLAGSEYLAARSAGLSGSSAVNAIGFTIPLSWAVLTVLSCLCLLGFADRAARRRPSAQAGLISVLVCALAVLALLVDQESSIHGVSYYFQKFVQAWAVIMLVAAGSFGHLLRRPVLAARGWRGFAVGVCVFLVALGATRSFWWSANLTKNPAPNAASNPGSYWSLSASTSWAAVWMARQQIVPSNIQVLAVLSNQGRLADGVPTIVVANPSAGENVNYSLQLAVLNQDAGTMGAVVYGPTDDQLRGLNSTTKLLVPQEDGGTQWSASQLHELAELEKGIQAVGTPIRVITSSQPLATSLRQWGAAHPGAISTVLYVPGV